MTQKEIDFIRSRWSGRACGTDVKKLVDEIDRLSDIVDDQTNTIEDKMFSELVGERPDAQELIAEVEDLKAGLEEAQLYRDDLRDEIVMLNEKLSQMEQ